MISSDSGDARPHVALRVGRVAALAGTSEHFVTVSPRLWKVGFAAGAIVWIFSAVLTEVTNDDILVPTVIILGSFLVPGTLSAFALSRKREGYLTTEEVVFGFLLAGTLALVSTAVMETYLLPEAKGTFIGVGIIEEYGQAGRAGPRRARGPPPRAARRHGARRDRGRRLRLVRERRATR